MVIKSSIKGDKTFEDKFGNFGNCLFRDDITKREVALNLVGDEHKYLSDEYEIDEILGIIDVCPEAFLILPRKIAYGSNAVLIEKLYKRTEKSILEYAVEKNAKGLAMEQIDGHAEPIRKMRAAYLENNRVH